MSFINHFLHTIEQTAGLVEGWRFIGHEKSEPLWFTGLSSATGKDELAVIDGFFWDLTR
jgi:hypothetical protein